MIVQGALFRLTRPDGFGDQIFWTFEIINFFKSISLLSLFIEKKIVNQASKLQSLMPLVTKMPTAKPREPKEKHPSYEITQDDCLDFIKRKDKQYIQKSKAASTMINKNLTTLQKHARDDKNSAPQPFFEGKEGMYCEMCLGAFGASDCLENQLYWVKCPYCHVDHHYKCISFCKECICGKKIRLQRKKRD